MERGEPLCEFLGAIVLKEPFLIENTPQQFFEKIGAIRRK
jgi:hypothetical protein